MLIGYARPYSNDPFCKEQQVLLTNMKCDQIICEESFSAKQRTKLANMIRTLDPEDKVAVPSSLLLQILHAIFLSY
ncbi:hypothetical protein NCCP133_31070 [Cytobacillus sp. NCCP-133]|nr:hypothetical protein NCCP133_31070 [Cytobacillus sp. NCCP-133]